MRFLGEGALRPTGLLRHDPAPTAALSAWADAITRPPSDEPEDDRALDDQPFWVSADSAPVGYAVKRPAWLPPAFLVALAAISAGIASLGPQLASAYAGLLSSLSGVEVAAGTVSIRPFVFAVFLLAAVFAPGEPAARLRLLGVAWGTYAVLMLGTDLVLARGTRLGWAEPLSPAGGLAAAGAALVAAVVVLFTQYTLPPGVHVPTLIKRPARRTALFTVALAGALACAVLVHEYRREILPAPNLPGLAALASLSVIVVAGLQLVLSLVGSIRSVPLRSSRSTPSVAFLVPAYNEQHGIAAVIRALDGAAAGYDGRCRLYLVDNASTDRTAREARAALAGCQALEGDVLTCRQRGKSHALNHGLAQTTEEIVIRVDADTIVPPTLLHDVVAYFDQPNVGGVSGLPLPRPDTPRALYAVRLMEVLYSVSFLRTGQNSVDATLVMPGNMSAYRGKIVRALGFAAGFNGEDTDVAVRIGRLGYRVVTDTRIRFLTEVPATLPHMVEQRTRWTRGVLYVAARNKSSLPLRQGLRGMLLLPWSALSACRRSLTLPLFTCLGASALVDPEMLSVRQVAVVGGAVLGVHLVLVTALVVVRGRLNAVPYLPAYVLFRLFKVYVAFGALLTLEPRATQARRRPALAY